MPENNEILNAQSRIEQSLGNVRIAQKKVQESLKALRQLKENREVGIDEPLNSEDLEPLLRSYDDNMDVWDKDSERLLQDYNDYSRIREIGDFPLLQGDLVSTKSKIETAQSNLKINKEEIAGLTAMEKSLETQLNSEGYYQYIADITQRIQDIETEIDELHNTEANSEEIDAAEGKKIDLENRMAQAENTFNTLSTKISEVAEEKNLKISEKEGLNEAYNSELTKLDQHLDQLCLVNDPRYLVSTFNDNTPFLLLPVRVETRFMTIKHVRRIEEEGEVPEETIKDKKELWVRVFPDDIAMHTHEKRLTINEQSSGETYWKKIWYPTNEPDYDANSNADPYIAAWRALVSAHGKERAAWIVKETEPSNLSDMDSSNDPAFPVLNLKPGSWTEAPKSKVLPDRFVVRIYSDDSNFREIPGNLIPDPLVVGIAPDDDDEADYSQAEGEVKFPDRIKWLTDYKEAEKVGMGISIPLEGEEINGIKKILVLGIKLSANKEVATGLFEELIENHHYTGTGFSLLNQGTPTNNTEHSKSGFEKIETDVLSSFNSERKGDLFLPSNEILEKSDGQWFSDMLGIDYNVVQNITNANSTDVCEALAMNRALWQSTMGNYMKHMLHPHVNRTDQKHAKKFFNDYVLGRGKIPAFRVSEQPYGVIVASAFSKWDYSGSEEDEFYSNLNSKVLQPMNGIWGDLADTYVKTVDINNPSINNPSKDFINIISLHASSVEFHQRYAAGARTMWNWFRFLKEDGGFDEQELMSNFLKIDGTFINNLADSYRSHISLNFAGIPKIFELSFLETQKLLNGPVIDGFDQLPYSEIRGIQPFPDTGLNYIHWLTDNATTIEKIRKEDFDHLAGIDPDQKPPNALLYLLLRHSYLNEYITTSEGLLVNADVVTADASIELEFQGIDNSTGVSAEEHAIIENAVIAQKTLEHKISVAIQVAEEFQGEPSTARSIIRSRTNEILDEQSEELNSNINDEVVNQIASFESNQLKWEFITKVFPDVSGTLNMEGYIENLIASNDDLVNDLIQVKESLNKLKGLPTARLERAFAEHLDLCNYRLDGWISGLMNQRLEGQQKAEKGIYLGAFGILENLKPNTSFPGVHVVELDYNGEILDSTPSVTNAYEYIGTDPMELMRDEDSGKIRALPHVDAANYGYVHTPSINHAVTAAILRAGYMSHQESQSDDDTLAVNLTSKRVRRALFYLEGMQNGQNLPALLGYRFERELHDHDTLLNFTGSLDQYILDLRKAYPLVAGGVNSTLGTQIEFEEAKNVVNGLALVEAYEDDNDLLITILPGIDENNRQYVVEVIDVIRDDMDAVADLLLAESVFQLSRGNMERSSAVLKALGEGGYIQTPEIINTPRQGKSLTHRFGIQFDEFVTSNTIWNANATARSIAEPALNGWISQQLPDPNMIVFRVKYDTTPDDENSTAWEKHSLANLGLEPIDFIHLMGDQGTEQDASELSSRIAYYVKKTVAQNDDVDVRISYLSTVAVDPVETTIFQLLPVIKEIKRIIGNSRPLRVDDFQLPEDAQTAEDGLFSSLLTDSVNLRLRSVTGLDGGFAQNLSIAISDLTSAMTLAGDIGDPVGSLNEVRSSLIAHSIFGVSNTIPNSANDVSEEYRDQLVTKATKLKDILIEKEQKANTLLSSINSGMEIKERDKLLEEVSQIIFGKSFRVYPSFEFTNALKIQASRSNTSLHEEIGPLAPEEWLQSASKVRPKMTSYQKLRLLSGSLVSNQDADLKVTQLPVISITDDRWVGMKLPADYNVPGDTLSIVLELPSNNDVSALQSGMLLDEWSETIPEENVQTGMAMHYNQPNAEAPNSLLLAVSPKVTGNWQWDDLMETLNETLGLAKKRAVEPDHLKEKIWGQTLPALVSSINSNDYGPSLDFGRNLVDVNNGQFGHVAIQDYDTN